MLEAGDLQCLKAIALMGGCRGPVWISSQSFGDSLSMSPQTASRRLKSLEGQRLIDRSLRPDGQYVTVTSDGEEALRKEYHRLLSHLRRGRRPLQPHRVRDQRPRGGAVLT